MQQHTCLNLCLKFQTNQSTRFGASSSDTFLTTDTQADRQTDRQTEGPLPDSRSTVTIPFHYEYVDCKSIDEKSLIVLQKRSKDQLSNGYDAQDV